MEYHRHHAQRAFERAGHAMQIYVRKDDGGFILTALLRFLERELVGEHYDSHFAEARVVWPIHDRARWHQANGAACIMTGSARLPVADVRTCRELIPVGLTDSTNILSR